MGFKSWITTGNFINKQFAYYDMPFKLDVFDEKTYSKSKTNFYAVMTNIETGKAEYSKVVNCTVQIEDLRASSSLPFLSKPVEIDGKKYLDGGIADAIPIEKALEDGYDKIVIVLTRPIEYRKKKSNQLLPKLFYHLIEKLQKKKKIYVIRPSKLIEISRVEKDPNKLQAMYDLGVEDYKQLKKELLKYLK